jgi:hypothetical protein
LAAEELTRRGTRVRFERVIHVPEDEMCFFVFGARSGLEAALVARRAGLDPIRVVEAISYGTEVSEISNRGEDHRGSQSH